MKKASAIHLLLRRIARIARMERGTLCRMTGRIQYNHQTWQGGRNVSRYVSPEDAPALLKAIQGYRRFLQLTQQYADMIIERTRAEPSSSVISRKRSAPPAQRHAHKRPRRHPLKDV